MTDLVFAALLRYWRGRRGLSQLDLSLVADVSARHISFLESGRSRPGEEMVRRLMSALTVPLRAVNEALRAAGYPARYPEPTVAELPPAVSAAIDRMAEQQEPYPLMLLDGGYDLLRANRSATRLLPWPAAGAGGSGGNVFTLVFDPAMARPLVANWETVAAAMLARLHRECLSRPDDARLSRLLDHLLTLAEVPASWRHPDFSAPQAPTLEVWLERDNTRMGFLTTVTTFSAPGQVTLDELRIDSWYPLDEETATACRRSAERERERELELDAQPGRASPV